MVIELVIDGTTWSTWSRGSDKDDPTVWIDEHGDYASIDITIALDVIATNHDRYKPR